MPYWRLSGYYLCYFASVGAIAPYWGLYLQWRGFDALAIGQLMAILMGARILAPLFWGHLADRIGHRMPIVRLGALVSMLCFSLVFLADGFWTLAAVLLVFSFFWNATLPQMEAVTFNHLGPHPARYALIRLWGSIGFVLVVFLLGLQLEWSPPAVVPVWVAGLCVGIWLTALLIPDSAPGGPHQTTPPLGALLRRAEVRAFLAVCFLAQLSHGSYYAFYSIHLEAAGYASTAVGLLWSLGVVSEVLVFLKTQPLMERFGARRMLIWSLALAALRWFLIGAGVDWPWVVILAQTLHAATFGIFHAAAIALVNRYFTGRTQGRGQALYSSIGFGAGGAAGSLLGGLLWSSAGPLATFGAASAVALGGLAVAWFWVEGDASRSEYIGK